MAKNRTNKQQQKQQRQQKRRNKRPFTRIPKTWEMCWMGVSRGAICTYAALADYTGNRSGTCNPQINTLARTLGITRKTIWRHLVELEGFGLVERIGDQLRKLKKGKRGQWGAWLYRLPHILEIRGDSPAKAVGHEQDTASNISGTKDVSTTPLIPPKERKPRRKRNSLPQEAKQGVVADRYRRWMGKDAQYHDEELADEHGQLMLTDAYQNG